MPQHHIWCIVFVFLIRNTKGWRWRWNEWWRETCLPLASLWVVIHSTLTAIQIHEKLQWLQFIAYIAIPTLSGLQRHKETVCKLICLKGKETLVFTQLCCLEIFPFPILSFFFWDLPTLHLLSVTWLSFTIQSYMVVCTSSVYCMTYRSFLVTYFP